MKTRHTSDLEGLLSRKSRNLKRREFEKWKFRESIPEDSEDHDMTKPQEPVETFLEKDSHKRKPTWAQELIQDA